MQSVNLYLPEYRPKREWLSLQTSVIGFVVFVVVIAVLHFTQSQHLQQLNQRIAELEQQEQAVKQQVEQLKQQAASTDPSGLQQQATQLRAAIDNSNAIKKVVANNTMGNQQGFSQHLFTLGEKRATNLVLNHIALNRGGDYVQLAGSSRSAAEVPLYVHNLQQTPVFASAKFGFLTITERDGIAHFRLSGNGAMTNETLQSFSESNFNK